MIDKPFWKRSEWYAAVALPYLATAIDSLVQLTKNGHLDPANPVFILLIKATAALSAVYAIGRSVVKAFGSSTVTEVPVITSSGL